MVILTTNWLEESDRRKPSGEIIEETTAGDDDDNEEWHNVTHPETNYQTQWKVQFNMETIKSEDFPGSSLVRAFS